jgi:DNA (cytosine-5)-methyltransferase 1
LTAYYNEIDPKAVAWLRELIVQGCIASGDVDERSITEVRATDLAGYDQCHFFAGIGVWSAALRGAGWPDTRQVWTGSCPCQPFSASGKHAGFSDARHLWPEWFRLIAECRPATVFGEQVASPLGLNWLDTVHADLEGAGYAVGAADLCAAGVGAPHIRQRLYFVADLSEPRPLSGTHAGVHRSEESAGSRNAEPQRLGAARELAHDDDRRREEQGLPAERGDGRAHPDAQRRREADFGACDGAGRGRSGIEDSGGVVSGPTHGFWRAADWLVCRDGKWRPVEPGTFPLAHGASARVGRLRGYGNAIVKPLAEAFIGAYCDVRGC